MTNNKKTLLDNEAQQIMSYIFNQLNDDEYIRVVKKYYNDKTNKYEYKASFYKDVEEMVNNLNQIYYVDYYYQLATTNENGGTKEDLKYRYELAFDFDLKDNVSIDELYKYTLNYVLGMSIKDSKETKDSIINDMIMFKDNEGYKEQYEAFKQLKKDLLQKIFDVLKDMKLYVAFIVDSGRGYHVHIPIKKTCDFEKINKVNMVLRDMFIERGLIVDDKAILDTQILRIPLTYNNKVKNVHLKCYVKSNKLKDSSNTLHRKSIDYYYKNFVLKKVDENKNIREDTPSIKRAIAKCDNLDEAQKELRDTLEKGTRGGYGNRYKALFNLTIYYKRKHKPLDEIIDIIKDWSYKSDRYDEKLGGMNNVANKVVDVYNYCSYYMLTTDEEKIKYIGERYTDFDWDKEEKEHGLIDCNTSITNKKKGRGKAMILSGKGIFVYNVLASKNDRALTKKEIVELVKDRKTKEEVIKEDTIRKALTELKKLGFITVEGRGESARYKIKHKDNDKYIKMSYFVNVMVIKKLITLEELQFYTFLRVLQAKMVEEGKCKGNQLTGITQEQLAKDFGVSEVTINTYLNHLYENYFLDKIINYDENNIRHATYYLNK